MMLSGGQAAWLQGNASRTIWEQAGAYALNWHRRKASWEVGTPDERILQIGSGLKSAKFRRDCPDALKWLASVGVSEAEAIRRFDEFRARIANVSDVFSWKPARSTRLARMEEVKAQRRERRKEKAGKRQRGKKTRTVYQRDGKVNDSSGHGDDSSATRRAGDDGGPSACSGADGWEHGSGPSTG